VLGSLGSASGSGASSAESINNNGDIAGYSTKYIGNTLIGRHAAIWSSGGTAVTDLNDVTDLPAGWVLTDADAINDAGMILAYASFDPDGSGPLAAEQFPVRLTPAPEPGLMGLLGISAVVLRRRRRVAV
jgi:MYXO-CTERM domain-containing protein